MPALVILDSISLSSPDGRPLFEGLTLAVGRERTGLVGRNGCGKSTLLRLISGETDPAGGTIHRTGTIGVLSQHVDDRIDIAQALGVADALARLQRLERGDGSLDDADGADWTLPSRIEAALAETGLPEMPLHRPIASLSGGERTRVALARLLVEAPDLLLLDEPTNNLDADGRKAVGDLLMRWQGGAIVASHDRLLLERVDRIVELTPVGVTVFGGAWHEFEDARDAARARAATELDRASDALRNAERVAQRAKERKTQRDKAGRAWSASGSQAPILLGGQKQRAENSGARDSRIAERQIEARNDALNQARSRVEVLTPLTIDLPATGLPRNRRLLACRDLEVTRGERRLAGPLSFDIRGPERIAIRGANGSGKTTLLRLIAGDLAPGAGEILRETDRIAVLDQHAGLLDPGATILDNMRRENPDLTDNAAHAALARFAFRNRAALQVAGTLSGGERLRAAMACVFARGEPPWLLMLDEPTNHLDIAAVEELEQALAAYDGALIVVSHDEAFLRNVGIMREIAL